MLSGIRQSSKIRIERQAHHEDDMSASSGEKRRRKRERRFLEFYDTVSMRATVAGVGGSIALLLWVAARSVLTS